MRDTRREILEGAGEVFTRLGYNGASMSQVAQFSGVSESTLYAHFATKDELFVAYIHERMEPHTPILLKPDEDLELDVLLTQMAEAYVALLLSDEAREVDVIALMDPQRFPMLAQRFYNQGPGMAVEALGQILTHRQAAGELRLEMRASQAAEVFFSLCRGEIFMRRMLGLETHLDEVARSEHVARVVRTFLHGAVAVTP